MSVKHRRSDPVSGWRKTKRSLVPAHSLSAHGLRFMERVDVQFRVGFHRADMRFASGLMAFLTAAVVTQMTACGDASGPKIGPPATILTVSGDRQTAEVGTKLANPLVIKVADAQGQNVAGVTVAWSAASGILGASSSLTDASGVATTEW